MKLISEDINKVIKKIFAEKDPVLANIIINWNKIVGHKFSAHTSPFKIVHSFEKGLKLNILHVQIVSSALSLEISFMQEVIIERIEVYLGFKAVHRLRLVVVC